jgi:aminobenzoyl-glutamate transport protein
MVASTFIIAAAGTWVTEAIVTPRLGPYRPEEGAPAGDAEMLRPLSPEEKRGLFFALSAAAVVTGLILWGYVTRPARA